MPRVWVEGKGFVQVDDAPAKKEEPATPASDSTETPEERWEREQELRIAEGKATVMVREDAPVHEMNTSSVQFTTTATGTNMLTHNCPLCGLPHIAPLFTGPYAQPITGGSG